MSNMPTHQADPRQVAEWMLDCEFAEHKKVSPTRGLLRFFCPDWAVDRMVSDALVQSLHLTALRRISEALGHPLKDVKVKTALDLADLAVAAIRAAQEKQATR